PDTRPGSARRTRARRRTPRTRARSGAGAESVSRAGAHLDVRMPLQQVGVVVELRACDARILTRARERLQRGGPYLLGGHAVAEPEPHRPPVRLIVPPALDLGALLRWHLDAPAVGLGERRRPSRTGP